jgi:hypothetical protein
LRADGRDLRRAVSKAVAMRPRNFGREGPISRFVGSKVSARRACDDRRPREEGVVGKPKGSGRSRELARRRFVWTPRECPVCALRLWKRRGPRRCIVRIRVAPP